MARFTKIARYRARRLALGLVTLAFAVTGTPLAPVAAAYAAETPVPPGVGLQAAIAAASPGDSLVLSAGEYTTSGQVAIDKAITIKGAGTGQTVIKTSSDTAGASIVTSTTTGWFSVRPGGELTISDLTMDGEHSAGRRVGAAVYASGPLHASNVRVTDVWWGNYVGIGFVMIGSGHDVTGCSFDAIERLGLYIGAGSTLDAPDLPPSVPYGAVVDGCSFTGSGPGDHCQYSMEVGRSGRALVRNCYFTGYSGVTASGAWNSAGLLVDSYYGSGTAKLTLEDSTFEDCYWGIEVGYTDQLHDTITEIYRTTFNRCNIDMTVGGSTSVIRVPIGEGNSAPDLDWTYNWLDEHGTTVTPPPALPDGFINRRPVSASEEFDVSKNVALRSDAPGILANDSDADDDALTIVPKSEVAHGDLTLDADGGFTYVPDPGFEGIDFFTYSLDDWLQTSEVATVTLTVANDAPAVADDAWSVRQNGLLLTGAEGVLTNDSDANGDPLSARVSDGVDHGVLNFASDGTFVYQPNDGFVGIDGFTYCASDGATQTVGTVTLSVANAAPSAQVDGYTVAQNGTLAVSAPGVLGNDSDGDGDQLSTVMITPPAHGNLVLANNGSFMYQPNKGFHGTDSFAYRASDGASSSGSTVVTIDVVNAAPIAVADVYGVARGGLLTVSAPGVMTNDTDAEGDTLAASLVDGVDHGELTFSANGGFVYQPSVGFGGADAFTYTVSDGTSVSPPVTVSITVHNAAPVGVADSYAVQVGETLAVLGAGVLGNDSDADGDALSATKVTGAANGTLVLAADGAFMYTPNPGFRGTDSFTYTATDGFEASGVTTVTLAVANSVPIAVADTYSTGADEMLAISGRGVLANDTDADADALSAVRVTGPTHGTLALNADGSFIYVPDLGFSGTDTFTYRATDGAAESAVVLVSVAVENAVPAGVEDGYSVAQDNTLIVSSVDGVLANDSDSDGGQLVAVLGEAPANGTFVLGADGAFIYMPDAGFSGTDTFTYWASDGMATSVLVTVTLDVIPVPAAVSFATLSASRTLPKLGAVYSLSGTLVSGGAPLSGQRLVLQSSASATGVFADTGKSVTTAPNGSFVVTAAPTAKTFYRMRYAGQPDEYLAAVSAVRYALPPAWVGTPAAPATMYTSRTYSVSGLLKPAHVAGTTPVRVYKQRYIGGKWVNAGYILAKASAYNASTSKYTARIRLPYRGRWRVRAYSIADAKHASAWSGYDYVTVK